MAPVLLLVMGLVAVAVNNIMSRARRCGLCRGLEQIVSRLIRAMVSRALLRVL